MTTATVTPLHQVAPDVPPIAWFRDPQLTELTPMTITREGRIYGHMAAWDQDHLSFPGQRIKPPRSTCDYKWFHTGTVDVVGDDGETVTISAGKISAGGGHAGLSLTASETAAYYDDSTSVVALICATEDRFGIAYSGAILPDVGRAGVQRLKACGGVSGDWRTTSPGGGLNLLACLAVPTGGFTIPRARVASGAPLSLVAAGALAPRPSRLAFLARRVHPDWQRPTAMKVHDLTVDNVKTGTITVNAAANPEASRAISRELRATGRVGEYMTRPASDWRYDENKPAPSSAKKVTPAAAMARVAAGARGEPVDERAFAAMVADELDARRHAAERDELLAELDDTAEAVTAALADVDDTSALVASLLDEVDDTEAETAALLASLAEDGGVAGKG